MALVETMTGTIGASAIEVGPLHNVGYPLTVAVQPGSGCTITVEWKVGDTDYQAWSHGAVTAFASTTFVSPVSSLRFTRTVGSGTDSKYEVL